MTNGRLRELFARSSAPGDDLFSHRPPAAEKGRISHFRGHNEHQDKKRDLKICVT